MKRLVQKIGAACVENGSNWPSLPGTISRRLCFTAAILPPNPRTIPANVVDDSAVSAPILALKHVRQRSLIAWIRRELPEGSESLRLIAACVHAGGYLDTDEAADAAKGAMQALALLDQRWGRVPDEGGEDVGKRPTSSRHCNGQRSARAKSMGRITQRWCLCCILTKIRICMYCYIFKFQPVIA